MARAQRRGCGALRGAAAELYGTASWTAPRSSSWAAVLPAGAQDESRQSHKGRRGGGDRPRPASNASTPGRPAGARSRSKPATAHQCLTRAAGCTLISARSQNRKWSRIDQKETHAMERQRARSETDGASKAIRIPSPCTHDAKCHLSDLSKGQAGQLGAFSAP